MSVNFKYEETKKVLLSSHVMDDSRKSMQAKFFSGHLSL